MCICVHVVGHIKLHYLNNLTITLLKPILNGSMFNSVDICICNAFVIIHFPYFIISFLILSCSSMASLIQAHTLKLAMVKMNMTLKRNFNYLKPKQAVIAKELIVNHRDVLAILPTGFGKSLCFEILPFMSDVFCINQSTLVFILCPLDAIIFEKLHSLGQYALHMTPQILTKLSDGTQDLSGIKYLIGHPEQFLCDAAIHLFSAPQWQTKHIVVAIDEAHCVLKWGPSFRREYFCIKDLRSIFPTCSFLALSATIPVKDHQDIAKKLGLKSPIVITDSIDRANVKMIVLKRPPSTGSGHTVNESYDHIFEPLIEELKLKREAFPKTVVYTKLKWCGYAHEMALRPDMNGNPSNIDAFIAQYHQPCTKQVLLFLLRLIYTPPKSECKVCFINFRNLN